jgi:flagellar biosynthesis regulator FlaF
MKRADKIRLAQAAAAQERAEDTRDPALREAARQDWAQTRKAAREAFIAKQDWNGILNDFKERDGYYTPEERAKMAAAYSEELITSMLR